MPTPPSSATPTSEDATSELNKDGPLPADETAMAADNGPAREAETAADSPTIPDVKETTAAESNAAAEPENGAEPVTTSSRLRRVVPRWLTHEKAPGPTVLVALGVVAALLTAACITLFVFIDHATAQDDRERAAQAAAGDHITSLVSIDPTNVQGSFDKAIASSTGAWKQQLVSSGDTLTQAVSAAKVQTKVTISADAPVMVNDDTATVLVVAGVQSAANGRPGQPRTLRTIVNLQLVDGTWLVSGVEFA